MAAASAPLKKLGGHHIRWPRLEKKYTLGDLLGTGNFAKVYKGTCKKTGQEYALKVVEKKSMNLVRLAQEIQILETLKHPSIMGFIECIETKTKVVIVCELLQGGELFDRILKKGSYSESDAKAVVKELLSALEYAHSVGVIHRDLKPENIILTSQDNDKNVKISDFGLAKMLDDSLVTQTLCGTPMYVAPELLDPNRPPYGPTVDVWAVGVITFILLGGYPPFFDKDLAKLYSMIRHLDFSFDEDYWRDVSDSAKEFIAHLLVFADERPDAKTAQEHEWLADTSSGPSPALTANVTRLASFLEEHRKAPAPQTDDVESDDE